MPRATGLHQGGNARQHIGAARLPHHQIPLSQAQPLRLRRRAQQVQQRLHGVVVHQATLAGDGGSSASNQSSAWSSWL